MTNINIIIPDDIHKKLKIKAAIAEKPLKELIVELLEKTSKEVKF